jgi:hypothetical protein
MYHTVRYHILLNWLVRTSETARVGSNTICNTITTAGLAVVTLAAP